MCREIWYFMIYLYQDFSFLYFWYFTIYLCVFQDIPFLIIPGTHIFSVMRPMVSNQLCLVVCFIDIFVYIVYIIRERKNVNSYLKWTREELHNYCACLCKRRTTGMNRYSPGYQHGNSDDDENDPNHRYLDGECYIPYLLYVIKA